MHIGKVVDNPKIENAIDNVRKRKVSISEIANAPHYYCKDLRCINCREKLEVINGHTGFYLKHSPYGGDSHYDCSLFTLADNNDYASQLKIEFIRKQELTFNYSAVVMNESIKFYLTLPAISKKIREKVDINNGKIEVFTSDNNVRYISIKNLHEKNPTVFDLNDEPNISFLTFNYNSKRVKYHIGWYYKNALFAFKTIDNNIYLNKIAFEVDKDKEYAFISSKTNFMINGADIKCLKRIIFKNKRLFIYSIKIMKLTNEVDKFLLEHDCSFSKNNVYVSYDYCRILKYDPVFNIDNVSIAKSAKNDNLLSDSYILKNKTIIPSVTLKMNDEMFKELSKSNFFNDNRITITNKNKIKNQEIEYIMNGKNINIKDLLNSLNKFLKINYVIFYEHKNCDKDNTFVVKGELEKIENRLDEICNKEIKKVIIDIYGALLGIYIY